MKKDKSIYKGNILDSPIMFDRAYFHLSSFYFYFCKPWSLLTILALYLAYKDFSAYEIGIITGTMIGTKILHLTYGDGLQIKQVEHRVIQFGAIVASLYLCFHRMLRTFMQW